MFNALESIQAFEAGKTQRKDREQEAGRMKLGNALAGGNYKGGAAMAYGMGDLETGMKLQEYGKGLEDAEAEAKRVGLIKTGMGLLQTPAEQREAMRPQLAQTLQQFGVQLDPQQLAQMDLSDAGIRATLTTLQDTDSLMAQYQSMMAPSEYGAPVEAVGPDGKPAYVQWSKTGQTKPLEGYTPPSAAPGYEQITLADGEYEYIPGQPESLRKVGDSPVKSPLVGITMPGEGPQENAFMKEAGSIEARNFGSLVEMGQTSRRNRVILDQLDTEAAAIPGGLEAVAKNALGNLGIPVEGLSEIQATEALINQLVPAQRQPGSGPMSDRDLALFKASLPRLIQTAEGKTRILTNMKAINDYVISEGEIASRVLSGRITPEQGRAEMQALGNPLAGDPRTGAASGPQGADLQGLMAPDGDPVTEEDVAETMRKYNVTREQVIAHLRGQ
jgi:hypothetical protein